MVSIIVPVYNREQYLCECVDSVLAQTFHDWELIIVDDGSTDGSGAIADRYAVSDPRIKVHHVANGGPSSARNYGLKKSVGEHICFLDADDAIHPEALSIMVNGLSENDSDMFIAWMHRGSSLSFSRQKFCNIRIIDGITAIAKSLYQTDKILNSPWGKLYKRKICENNLFVNGIIYEDLDFFYRVCGECKKIAVSSCDLYFYRDTPDSITNVWSDKRLDVLDVVDRIEDYIAWNLPALLPAARDRKLSANFNMFILAGANGRYDVADRCWEVIREYRFGSLTNSRVRLKNKAGILLSYLGRRVFTLIGKVL